MVLAEAPQQADGPACTCCGKTRRLRRGSATCYEGGSGWCTACHSWWCKNGKPRGGPIHPSLRPKPGAHRGPAPWYERAATAAASSPQPRLQSGWHGYRPSTGTAGMGVAA